MKTQIELAREGIITEAMKKVAMDEGFGLDPEPTWATAKQENGAGRKISPCILKSLLTGR